MMILRLFSIKIPKFVFVISSFQFSRSSTKRKKNVVRSSIILTALVLLIVSRDLVLLRYLFFRLLTHTLTEGRQFILSKRWSFKSLARIAQYILILLNPKTCYLKFIEYLKCNF